MVRSIFLTIVFLVTAALGFVGLLGLEKVFGG